ERRDVALRPLQRGDRVHHPVVAGACVAGFLREIRVREEPERAEAVVDRDDDRTLGGEVLAVVPGEAAGAAGEAAAVDPQHHGPLVVRIRAGPDIQIEAVFAASRLTRGRGRCRWRPARSLATRAAAGAATTGERSAGRA